MPALLNYLLSACTALLLDSFAHFYNAHRINTVVPWFCAWCPSTLKTLLNHSFSYFLIYFSIISLLWKHSQPADKTATEPLRSALLFYVGLWFWLGWLGAAVEDWPRLLWWQLSCSKEKSKACSVFLAEVVLNWIISSVFCYTIKEKWSFQASHHCCSLLLEGRPNNLPNNQITYQISPEERGSSVLKCRGVADPERLSCCLFGLSRNYCSRRMSITVPLPPCNPQGDKAAEISDFLHCKHDYVLPCELPS